MMGTGGLRRLRGIMHEVGSPFQFRMLSRVVERLRRCEDPERFIISISRLQQARTVLQELQESLWHVGRLPSRQDVLRLRRRVLRLRGQVRLLEEEVERLALLVHDQDS
ncbi:MAG: hypothetical protein KTR25_17955 [Myxococcales bacterium]|nr:hypothetical protein [Myxococcales bacterium]